MEKLKKVTAKFLVLILIINTFVIVPLYDENYGDTVYADTVAEGGLPLYQANVIAKGYNNDGEGYYKLFKSFQNPVYYELTNYMLEDKILSWTSNFWNATFNSEFQKNPSYFYEVMLMGYLKYEQKEINTSGVWDSKEMALATEIYKELADQLTGSLETKNYNQILNQVDTMSNDELKRVLKNVDCIKLSSDILDDLSKGMDYGTEFIDAIAEYEALFDAKSERIESLKLLRAKVTDNDYFTKAVDDIIEKMEQTPINYVAGKMINKLWDDFLNTAWNLIIEGSPIAAILKAINIEKMTLDVLFNSSDTASNNFKLLVLYIVDTYFDSTLEQSLKNYNGMSSVSNGVTLIQCYKGYIEYQMYGLDYTKTFINDIVDEGSIHHIIEQIFFKESIQSAEELTRLCDSQIKSRQRILELLENSADIYYRKTGLDELVNELNKTEEKNVPVTSVSFSQSEITLKSMSDICLIYANVYPSNATNKKVTYTCSDPSILSVPVEGGFATQKGEGTVTVTATTEDGGFTATQIINVSYTPALSKDYHGKCGKNVYWTLYSDGTMCINGDGDMESYSSKDAVPWHFYKDSIKAVIVGDKVTSISNYAFVDCSLGNVTIGNELKNLNGFSFDENLKHITIGNSITSIENNQFNGCTSLEEIVIPDSVTSVKTRAFYGCTSLANVIVGNAVKSVSAGAFLGCPLENVIIGDALNSLEGFYFDKKLKTIIIGNNVVSIPECKFRDCVNLENVTIGSNVTSIGKAAFENCKSLKTVTIPDSVKSVENYAFGDCSSLESITIGNSVTKIGFLAFGDCTNITRTNYTGTIEQWVEIEFEADGYGTNPTSYSRDLYINNKLVTEINLTTATKISSYAFYNCTSIERVTIPNSVTMIGTGAFCNCKSLKNVIIPDCVTSVGASAFSNCPLENVVTGDGIKNLNGFRFDENLKKIVIGNSITSIEDNKFEKCINLESVTIGNSVESIGNDAFFGCKNLKKTNYTGTVDQWAEIEFKNSRATSVSDLFYSNPTLQSGNLYINDKLVTEINLTSVTEISDAAFYNCKNLKSVVIGDNTTKIGLQAFEKCANLENITIGKNVTNIDYCAFEDCTNLKKTNYTGTINQWVEITSKSRYPTYYSEDLYINNQLVTEVNITTATEINDAAFYNCKSLKNVIIGNSVTSIGKEAFRSCKSLTRVVLPESITSIASDTFNNCINIEEIVIPDGVTSIDNSAFALCINLKKVKFGNNLTSIEGYAFEGCNIKEIIIPHSVIEIRYNAFGHNVFGGVNDIYYAGSESEWNNINIGFEDNNKPSVNIHYNTSKNDYIVSEKIEPDCENDGEYVYTCPHGFTKTETISALGHDGNVKEIIPSTCSNSGYTLYECKRCGETYKSDYMKPLGHEFINGICKNCGKMEDECIESSHPYENDYDESWTINKAGAKSISITFSEDTEVEYGYDYIYIYDQNNNEVGCYTGNALASKTITVSGDTVKIRLKTDEVGVYYGFSIVSVKANYNELQKYNDFEYCALDDGTIEIISYIGSETKLRIPEKINDCPVKRIGNNTFNNNTKLEAIEIPTTIKSIGNNAFYGCTELKDVYYNGDSNYDLDDLIEIGDGNANLLIYASIHYYSMEDNSDDKSDNVNETTTTTVAKPNVQETTTVAETKSGDNNTQKKIPTAKIKKVKRSKKSLKISWKRIKGVSGYQIQYSTSGKFKKSKKITIRKAQATLGNINKLKTKTKYYIRIRTYIVDNGKKKYSSWSKKVMQKTK